MISRIRSPFYIFFLNPVYVAYSLATLAPQQLSWKTLSFHFLSSASVVLQEQADELFVE